MGRSYKLLLALLPAEKAPAFLCERVTAAIGRKRAQMIRARLALSSLLGAGSLVGMVFSVQALAIASATSGFASYVSLLTSDSSLVSSNFMTYLATLAESLPGVEVTITLALVSVFLVSLRSLVHTLILASASRRSSIISAY